VSVVTLKVQTTVHQWCDGPDGSIASQTSTSFKPIRDNTSYKGAKNVRNLYMLPLTHGSLASAPVEAFHAVAGGLSQTSIL
jgi:hypothetical protein